MKEECERTETMIGAHSKTIQTMPGGRHTHASIGLPAVRQIADALDTFCAEEQLSEDVVWRLRVALDEVVANIANHGGNASGAAGIDVWFRRHAGEVEITVADDGPPFDPLSHPMPDVTLPLEQRHQGGLGIALIKSLMDGVCYTRTTRNVLTMRKQIDAAPARGGENTDEDSTS